MDEDLVAYVQSDEFRKASADHIASLSEEELARQYAALRDRKGRFRKGGASPNPTGRRGHSKPPRLVTTDQTVADLLGLMEQPVKIRKGKSSQTVPAIVAIYDQLIHKAIKGDWQAVKMCIALREKYASERTESIVRLAEEAMAVRTSYEGSVRPTWH